MEENPKDTYTQYISVRNIKTRTPLGDIIEVNQIIHTHGFLLPVGVCTRPYLDLLLGTSEMKETGD